MISLKASDRNKLPGTRSSLTHRREICGYKCYFTVSFYEGENEQDRCKPGEVFVAIAKQGSVVSGLMDGVVTLLSIGLQYGIPWPVLKDKLEHHRFGNEAQDQHHVSLLDGLVKAVDHVIAERKKIIGAEEVIDG